MDQRERALVDQDFRCIVKALAALRAHSERFVNGIGITGATACGAAQRGFANGVADADVHWPLPSNHPEGNANGSQ